MLCGFAVLKMALARGADMAGGVAFPFGPDLSASGWRPVSSPWRRGARFSAHGKDTLVVETTGGFGLLWHAVPRQVAKAEKARWRWRMEEGVGPTDLTRRGGDDRVLALYFAFADPSEMKSGRDLSELLRRGRGKVLVYVWGGAAKPGTVLPLPYFDGRGRTIVKRAANAEAGIWFDQEAAVRADFTRAFGQAPGHLVAVAVSSDADDTGGRNVVALADLCVK
jgi:hypothetical protein